MSSNSWAFFIHRSVVRQVNCYFEGLNESCVCFLTRFWSDFMNFAWRSVRILAVLCLCTNAIEAADETVPKAIANLADMSKSGTLFSKESYKNVRGNCSMMFEERFQNEIKTAYGDDFDAMTEWLDKHKEIKEEFYTAIDEKFDKVPAALQIFHDLWKKSPEQVAKFPNLAIAHAIVWDDPRGLYDYRHHQVRTRSVLPDSYDSLTAVQSFQDYIDRSKELQAKEPINRLQAFPWEFLIHVVNHKTPIDERKWALKNYLAKRPMIGKIYHEVQYDQEMLRTQSKTCKLNDKPYTLESILKNGGVCAMQGDFAARVGKSLVVPAAYVTGESQFQDLHAWVMWVEFRSAAGGKINFTLESYGRYLGDQYYTGNLIDPHTAEKILDRDMERRLSAVAHDRLGKRQAELGMKYYGEICQARDLDQKKKVLFLDRCLSLSPFNETAWLELARQVKQGELEADLKQIVLGHLESMLKTFAKYPDFTWKVANDLILIQPNKPQRNAFFERLVILYETAGRPDLACEARLKWAAFQTDDEKWAVASKGLAQTIQKFPSEGRYIPKLVDRLKEVSAKYKGGVEYMSMQYQELLRKIPPKRGADPNKFFIQMHEQAIAFFKDNKKDKIVKELETRLVAVKSGK